MHSYSKGKCFILMLFLWIGGFSPLHSNDNRSMKILVLIIASDDLAVYSGEQNIWKEYMHLDKEHVEAYFLKNDPELFTDILIQEETIWCKGEESLVPGIIKKTVLALELFNERLYEFDYILRTNLSSFYIFPRLFKFLETLPKKNCYCGCLVNHDGIIGASGAGAIFSPDVADLLLSKKSQLFEDFLPDDVAIGKALKEFSIPVIHSPRTDFLSLKSFEEVKNHIPHNAFHFRIKNSNEDLRSTDELTIQKALLEIFYLTH